MTRGRPGRPSAARPAQTANSSIAPISNSTLATASAAGIVIMYIATIVVSTATVPVQATAMIRIMFAVSQGRDLSARAFPTRTTVIAPSVLTTAMKQRQFVVPSPLGARVGRMMGCLSPGTSWRLTNCSPSEMAHPAQGEVPHDGPDFPDAVKPVGSAIV